MSDADGAQAQRQKMSAIEKECAEKSGLRCDVVTLYGGGMYNLYKYKKYTDVRVVFAPEAQMAFFGGDHDNFEYPRYDLDITYFRIYENDKPVHLANYLKWSHHRNQGRRSGLCLRKSRRHRAPAHHGRAELPQGCADSLRDRPAGPPRQGAA